MDIYTFNDRECFDKWLITFHCDIRRLRTLRNQESWKSKVNCECNCLVNFYRIWIIGEFELEIEESLLEKSVEIGSWRREQWAKGEWAGRTGEDKEWDRGEREYRGKRIKPLVKNPTLRASPVDWIQSARVTIDSRHQRDPQSRRRRRARRDCSAKFAAPTVIKFAASFAGSRRHCSPSLSQFTNPVVILPVYYTSLPIYCPPPPFLVQFRIKIQ